jgi:hypothetical protein
VITLVYVSICVCCLCYSRCYLYPECFVVYSDVFLLLCNLAVPNWWNERVRMYVSDRFNPLYSSTGR